MRNSHRETITFKLALMKTVGCSFMFFTAALKLLNLRQGAIVTLQILFKNQIFLMKVMPKQKNKKTLPAWRWCISLQILYIWAADKFSNPPTFWKMTKWPNTLFFFFLNSYMNTFFLAHPFLYVCVCAYTQIHPHTQEKEVH